MKLAYFGTPEFSASLLELLIQSNTFSISAVITQPDKPVGRKKILSSFISYKLYCNVIYIVNISSNKTNIEQRSGLEYLIT